MLGTGNATVTECYNTCFVLKDEKKYFKHVLKLDKNFHVYIHGEKKYIRKGYDPDRDMNYYVLYFRNEE